jgi:hypothetical protein
MGKKRHFKLALLKVGTYVFVIGPTILFKHLSYFMTYLDFTGFYALPQHFPKKP